MNCCTLYAFDGTILHKNFKSLFATNFNINLMLFLLHLLIMGWGKE